MQLFHGGQRAPLSITGRQPWSATAGAAPGAEPSRAATAEDIQRVISQFRDAAVRTHSAGFAGIELHGAHGYLLCQFLSGMNTRTDGWGGSLEGRARLVCETMRAVRSAVPEQFVVGVRLSPEDHGNARGLDLDESGLAVCGHGTYGAQGGYGEFDPVDTNDSKDGRSHNRRTEITRQPNIDEIVAVPPGS